MSIRHGIAFLEPRNIVLKGYGVEDLDLDRDRNFLGGLRLRLEYVPQHNWCFRILTVLSAHMLRTSLTLREKATAAGHRFLLLSLLLRQLSPMHNDRCDPASTHQQPVQTCRQFQVHPMTPFNPDLLHLPRSTTNLIVQNRWRNYHAERPAPTHRYHPPATVHQPPRPTSRHRARPWSPR